MYRMCQHAGGCDGWNDFSREILWSDLFAKNMSPQFFDDNRMPTGFPMKFWSQPETPPVDCDDAGDEKKMKGPGSVTLTEKHSRSRSRSRDERIVTKLVHGGMNKISAPTEVVKDSAVNPAEGSKSAASSSSGQQPRSREAALADAHQIFKGMLDNMLQLSAALQDATKAEKAESVPAASSRISKKQPPVKKDQDKPIPVKKAQDKQTSKKVAASKKSDLD